MKRRVRILSLIIILTATLAGGFLYLRYSSRPEREVTLKMDLRTMRQAIDQYTMDKQHPPQSLRDLVNGHYLRQIPTDHVHAKRGLGTSLRRQRDRPRAYGRWNYRRSFGYGSNRQEWLCVQHVVIRYSKNG